MVTKKFSYETPELEEAKYGIFLAGDSDWNDDFGDEDGPDGE